MTFQSTIIYSFLILLSLTYQKYSDRVSTNIPAKRIETRAFIKSFGAQLKEKDIEKLRPYFTEDCFAQFLVTSDSLGNNYPRRIRKAIELRQFAIEKTSDTTSVLSL